MLLIVGYVYKSMKLLYADDDDDDSFVLGLVNFTFLMCD
jgi:hypothetical protein